MDLVNRSPPFFKRAVVRVEQSKVERRVAVGLPRHVHCRAISASVARTGKLQRRTKDRATEVDRLVAHSSADGLQKIPSLWRVEEDSLDVVQNARSRETFDVASMTEL